jgi:hypothetical protein
MMGEGTDSSGNLIDNIGSGSNDYFGLTNATPTPAPGVTNASSFLDAINSTAASIGGTALSVQNAESGINAVLNGGNNPAAQAAHANTVAQGQGAAAGSVSAGNLFGSDAINKLFGGGAGAAGGSGVLLLLLLAAGAYFFLRH